MSSLDRFGYFQVRPTRADELQTGDEVFPFKQYVCDSCGIVHMMWCTFPYTVTKVNSINKKTWTIKIKLKSCYGSGEPCEWTEIVMTNHIILVIIKEMKK